MSAEVVASSDETQATGRLCARCGQTFTGDGWRCSCGAVLGGNTAAMRHGMRSAQARAGLLPEQAEALAALAAKRAEVEQDLGGTEQLSGLARDQVQRYLELSLVADYLGTKLAQEGPLSGKGRTRACLSAYLSVVDRLLRIASTLGLERRAKRVPRPEDWIEGKA